MQEDLSSLPEEEASQRGEEASRREFLTPFDLARPPLMRALLLKLGPDRHRLTLTAHHIICDGWSYGVLMHELPLFYRSACGESLPALAPAPSYAAYAETRTDAASRGEFEEARAWWRGQFATLPQPLELPADLPRRADTPLDADSLEIPLPAALTARLRNFCRANKVTPYVAFLTAWQCLLGRLTGQDDVVIGTPLACPRNAVASTPMAGFVVRSSAPPSSQSSAARTASISICPMRPDAPAMAIRWIMLSFIVVNNG